MNLSLDTQLDQDSLFLKRVEVLDNLKIFMDASAMTGAKTCTTRLFESLPHVSLHDNVIFVAYGGGKDSSYMVAFVRLIQLLLYEKYKTTFRLRIATNRHSGMPFAVMENIDRVYKALGFYDDPDVELFLIDGFEVKPFAVDCPIPTSIIERNRLDILMTGHRCQGEARPTFCNACNLSMINSFGLAISYGNGVDIIITGDSIFEQRAYVAWVRRIAGKFEMPRHQTKITGFVPFLNLMDQISQNYFNGIYGGNSEEVIEHRIHNEKINREPQFFSIFEDTSYQAGDHWELLTDYLGFYFDDLAFSFTESDCANPALMAHLRGLKVEHVYNRSYSEGISEYLKFALNLMVKKDFPVHLIEIVKERYKDETSVAFRRTRMNNYAKEVLDLNEEQLVCMLYSPFNEKGKNLLLYLEREQPELLPYCERIHKLLEETKDQNQEESNYDKEKFLIDRLISLTHLDIERLRIIYNVDMKLKGNNESLLDVVLTKDPHKALIETSYSPEGPKILELLSGR